MTTNPSPLFSIITVNLNHAIGLEKTLQSVQNQQGEDIWEQLVIDGGSTDRSCGVLREYADMITYQVSETDTGIYQAMNKGIAAAKGMYLLFLNSGDTLSDPEVLKSAADELHTRPDLLYGNSLQPEKVGEAIVWREHKAPELFTPLVLFQNGICHQAVFFHRELLAKLEGYNESYRIAGDWELEARALLQNAVCRHFDRAVACYEGGGLSRKSREAAEAEKAKMQQETFPSGLQEDYRAHLLLRKEVRELRELKTWQQQICERSWFKNLAMITKWSVLKFCRKTRAGNKN